VRGRPLLLPTYVGYGAGQVGGQILRDTPALILPIYMTTVLGMEAALVPGPRSHLTRYHGVFAPHARWRSAIVPGRPAPRPTADRTPAERHKAMTWAQRLARVFKINVTRCERCAGLRPGHPAHRQARPGPVDGGRYRRNGERNRVRGREFPHCTLRPWVGDAAGDARVTAPAPSTVRGEGV
jgi:hypothetical protein